MKSTQIPMSQQIVQLMNRVYAFMGLAFIITSLTAYYIAHTPSLAKPLFSTPIIFWGIIIAQLILVVLLTFMMQRLSMTSAIILFFLYAITIGITFSIIFLQFQLTSIYIAFFVSACMFVSMAIYGYFTRSDLSTLGNFLFMSLIGLLIGLVVNIFLKSQVIDIILSSVGVMLFTALTAYDAQRIKYSGKLLLSQGQNISKASLFGALTLYLDFINLFLYVLQLTGRRRS